MAIIHWSSLFSSVSSTARVLLRRQEKETLQGKDDSWCVKIWEKLIETLKVNALKDSPGSDVNVDHLQLLLVIWHNFTKAQRDKIFVLCVQAVTDVCNDPKLYDKIPVCTYQLLLLLDYFIYQHNTALPKNLLTQVEHNLFKAKQGMSCVYTEEEILTEQRLLFFQCVEREDQDYQRTPVIGGLDSIPRRTPRFYGIRQNNGEQNLDKNAMKQLFSVFEKNGFNYADFYQKLITLLNAGSNCGHLMRRKQLKSNLSDSKVVRCMFGLCWRLIIALPPPITFLKDLQQNLQPEIKNTKDLARILLRLHWHVFLTDPSNDETTTTKDTLVLQNMTPSEATQLIFGVYAHAKTFGEIVKEYTWCLQQISDNFVRCDIDGIIADHLPGSLTSLAVDCIITRVYFMIKTLSSLAEIQDDILVFVPLIMDFIRHYQAFARFCILYYCIEEMPNDLDSEYSYEERSLQDINMFSKVIKIGSCIIPKPPVSPLAVISDLPLAVKKSIQRWNNLAPSEFRPHFADGHVILNEGNSESPKFISSLVSMHMKLMSFRFPFNLDASIRYIMRSLVQLTSYLMTSTRQEGSNLLVLRKEVSDAIVPLTVDASFEYLTDQTYGILEYLFGSLENEDCCSINQQYLLNNCNDLMMEHSFAQQPVLSEEILIECERYVESLFDKPQGKGSLQKFFQGNDKFVKLLLGSAHQNFSLSYVHRMLKLVSRVLELYDKQHNDAAILSLVQSISMLSNVSKGSLTTWLSRIIVGGELDREMTGKMADNRLLLQSVATSLVREKSVISSKAIEVLLDCVLPLGTKLLGMATDDSVIIGSKFVDFLSISSTLAGYGDGSGHLKLMKNVVIWLQTCKDYMRPQLITDSKENSLVQCTNVLLSHIADVLAVLKQSCDEDETISPTHGDESFISDAESDGVDEEEESGAEESEEDSEGNQLWNKLCTFTTTRKEFANQHWYHCHTCRMNDGVGVCTICAKVCHKNHDVTYAKYGSFFCDCGAKEDDSCRAMKKRSPHENVEAVSPEEKVSSISSYRRLQRSSDVAEPVREAKNNEKQTNYEIDQPVQTRTLRKHLEPNRNALKALITDHEMCQAILTLLSNLSCSSHNNGDTIIGGARKRIAKALKDLHTLEKTVENNDMLLVPTLGSQEGAFENVKLVCSGEQGQATRQLLGTHVLRRVAMCCLTSTKGRRQHLAVSHEKGKITILQLSTLLKQADSSRRKLTLTRLATTQVPFTILSLTGNSCNEHFLAVCGLKDCHVLTLSNSGSVVNHLALHPQLEAGNFIIKAVWLPGSQTELAIVTADFVKGHWQ